MREVHSFRCGEVNSANQMSPVMTNGFQADINEPCTWAAVLSVRVRQIVLRGTDSIIRLIFSAENIVP